MKVKSRRTKICLYLFLVVLTLFFAWNAFVYYDDDLESRVNPQVERAIIQVSKLLPQLEENEEALREVSSNLEKSRRRILKENEDVMKDEIETDAEKVETVIDNTLSWMNRITKLRVGRQGHVVVVSQEDFSILAHPNKKFVGEELYLADDNLDTDDIPDLGELGGKITKDDILHEFHLFFPESIYQTKIDGKKLLEAFDAGIYGSVFAYKDTFILCGTTLREALIFVFVRCIFTTLIFFSISWILVRYIGFALDWHKESKKSFRGRLVSLAVVAVVGLFGATWYYQAMMDVTGDIATMNDHAAVAVDTLNAYRKYRTELSDWLDQQYLEQCRLAKELVLARGADNLSRQDLAEYADDLGVKYIYVFDKNGKTIVTNSPYDHFEISKDEEDQSFAFRPLLDGREYVIQEVMKDDSADEKLQYVGVSLRDENDLADGFVQIAVDPALRERLINPINVQTVLDNLVIGLPEYAIAVDKGTMKIVATTGLGHRKSSVEDLGVDVENLKSDFSGILTIDGDTYYAGVSESEDLYLMPIVRGTDDTNAGIISLRFALYGIVAYFLLVLIGLFGYARVLKAVEMGQESEKQANLAGTSDDEGEEEDDRGIFHTLSDMIRKEEKADFDIRWKKQRAIPIEKQSPELRTGSIVYRMLLLFSIALVTYETYLTHMGRVKKSLDGFAYVLLGNWERGVNLFSFSFCLFLFCVLYVFQELLNQILYHVAKISDLKKETILLLMRNALKYAVTLIFLYIGLAKFGIDTKTLWASAGVLSLMIGFGAKDLMNDIIAGMFIIFEGTYKIGDFVMVGNWFGTVQEIGIRYTKISYFSETKIFNNSSIRDIINNDGEVAREVLKIPMPYEMDLLEMEQLLARELPLMAANIPGLVKPPKYQGVNSFDDNCIMLRIVIFCDPFKRRKAVRALQREIKLLYDRENINIPYNHVVVMDYKDELNTYYTQPEGESAAEPTPPGGRMERLRAKAKKGKIMLDE